MKVETLLYFLDMYGCINSMMQMKLVKELTIVNEDVLKKESQHYHNSLSQKAAHIKLKHKM